MFSSISRISKRDEVSDSNLLLRVKVRFRHVLTIAKKDAKIYYLKAPVLIFGILFPFCLFLAFVIGRDVSPNELLPGLVGMTLFFTASSATPIVAPWETRMRTLERLISTPVSVPSIILGDILAGFTYGMAISVIPLSFGIFALGVKVVNPFIIAIDIILGALCFSALGSLLSSPPTDNPSNVMMLSNLFRLPLIFISGVFIPIERMPGWGKAVALISPLTYACDLARHSLLGEGYYPVPLDITMILTFSLVFIVVGIAIHRRNIYRRLS
jgi:ABC-2 type transport system permease protein